MHTWICTHWISNINLCVHTELVQVSMILNGAARGFEFEKKQQTIPKN